MNFEERQLVEIALGRIPRLEWKRFFRSDSGRELASSLAAVRDCLRLSGKRVRHSKGKLVGEVVDLLGSNILRDREIGPWIRERLLHQLPETKWRRLFDDFRDLDGSRVPDLHGGSGQFGLGSSTMAKHWVQGGHWARRFCEVLKLPDCVWHRRARVMPDDEEVLQAPPLPPLHDFQREVYDSVRKLLRKGRGRAAVLSLPTGAGKTRVATEAVCDHLAAELEAGVANPIALWIAQNDELLRQAWESFRHVWLSPTVTQQARRPGPLSLIRAWGGRPIKDISVGDGATIVIAGVQQLHSWAQKGTELQNLVPQKRLAVAVIDEAHRVLNDQHSSVLRQLDLRDERRWRTLSGSAPVIGLTATPWRRNEAENRSLSRYFQKSLFTPERLGANPIRTLQEMEILSKVRSQRLSAGSAPRMTTAELRRFEEFKDLPPEYLKRLGLSPERNAAILQRLASLPRRSSTLVFACSVVHAELLTLGLNRILGAGVAALVTGETPQGERVSAIERFRSKEVRFLCNVGVLTTGFDAPATDVIFISRPTASAVLYEQMVGRGLRGPRNGGTSTCTVIDVQDRGLPREILSYARVIDRWKKR